MIISVIHLTLMFLLVFGPRLYGSLVLDTLTLTCAVIIAHKIFANRFKFRVHAITKNTIAILLLLLLYSTAVSLAGDENDLFYPGKFLRALINWMGVIFFCDLINKQHDDPVRYLSKLYVGATFLHCIIVIGQWTDAGFGELIKNISGYAGSSEYRFTGLTWSFNATNIANGLALAFLIFFKPRLFSLKTTVFFFGVIAIAMSGLGRTSFLLTVLFSSVVYFQMERKKLATTVIGFFTLASAFFGFELFKSYFSDNVRIIYLLDPITLLLGGDSLGVTYTTSLYDTWLNFFIFPSNPFGLLFGYGISGRGETYVASDVGYILLIWGIGIFGLLLIVGYHLYIIRAASLLKFTDNARPIRAAIYLFSFLILVVSLKEQEFFVRHLVTGLALLVWFIGHEKLMAKRNKVEY